MIPDNNPDTNSEIAALKNQIFVLLVALVVVSGTLTVYLYRQVSLTGKDIAQDEQWSQQVQTNKVVIESFVGRLVAYGQKHPDFEPVLKKYGIVSPTGQPVPMAPAPKK